MIWTLASPVLDRWLKASSSFVFIYERKAISDESKQTAISSQTELQTGMEMLTKSIICTRDDISNWLCEKTKAKLNAKESCWLYLEVWLIALFILQGLRKWRTFINWLENIKNFGFRPSLMHISILHIGKIWSINKWC